MSNTKNLSTLKINKLTKAQYERELADGNIDEDALYLTSEEPDTVYFTYGESTFNEIKAAYDAGKTIYVKYDNSSTYAILSSYYDEYSFSFCSGKYNTNYIMEVNNKNEWSTISTIFAYKSDISEITQNTVYFTYGESTYDEIKAAYDAGKNIYVKDGDTYAIFTSYNGANRFQFGASKERLNNTMTIDNNNNWTKSGIKLAQDADLPKITYGTKNLTAGTSELETGALYFVYE